jgi:uncharacterized protein YdgA (DUF945 family)
MKKISLIAILVALLVVFLISPKIVGNKFNTELDDSIALVNSALPFYNITVSERNQGWFSTQATINVSLDLAQLTASSQPDVENISVDVSLGAQHGLLLTQSGLGLGWLDWQWSIALPNNPDAYEIITTEAENILAGQGRWGLGDSINSVGNVPDMDIRLGSNDTFFSLSAMEVETSWDGNLLVQRVTKPSSLKLMVKDQEMLVMSDIGLESTVQTSNYADMQAYLKQMLEVGLYDGELVFSIGEMTVKHQDRDIDFALNDFQMILKSSLNQEDNSADLLLAYLAKTIDIPAYQISDAVFEIEFKGMQESFVRELNSLNKEMSQNPEKLPEFLENFVQTHVLEQLKAEPQLNINKFNFTLNDSSLTSYANTSVTGVAELPAKMQDPAFWLQHGILDLKINVQEALAKQLARIYLSTEITDAEAIEQQLPAVLEMYVAQGMLVKTEAGYELSLTLKDSQLNLNGNPIPL